jgi:mono/diheme cytochrome c family protein
MKTVFAAALSGAVLFFAGGALAQELAAPTYTAAQAERGKAAYAQACAGCHGADMTGGEGDGAPTLVGPAFTQQWAGGGLDKPYAYMTANMPGSASLPASTYADLMAYILQQNGVPAGTAELPDDPSKTAGMAVPK